MEHPEKKRHSLLKLLCIYMAAIITGVIAGVIIPDSKAHSVIFYVVVILGLIIYMKQEKCDWKKWFSRACSH